MNIIWNCDVKAMMISFSLRISLLHDWRVWSRRLPGLTGLALRISCFSKLILILKSIVLPVVILVMCWIVFLDCDILFYSTASVDPLTNPIFISVQFLVCVR